jgi:ABC-type transport system substrate-binding protein
MWKLLLPFLLLAGLIATTVLTDRPMPRADFTFINRGDVTTLDVSQMSWMQDIRACKICYEGLVRNDVFSREFRIAPAAAERWEISPDKLTYTFHLRPDAKWSNGQPLKASDFIFSWRRAILPDTAADYSGFMMFIKGGQAFFDWRSQALADFARHLAETGKSSDRERAEALWKETLERFDRMFMARAVDDRTIVITLERPTPYFLDLCGFVTYFPVYEPLVKAYEFIDPETARVKYDQSWTKPPLAVFNGPFVVDVWRFKRDMHFTKNPHYWDRDNIEIDTISIPTVEDPNAAVMSFRTGAVDWVSDVVVPYRAEMLVDKQQFYREHQADYDALVAQGLDPIEIDRRLPPDPRKNIHAFPAFGTYFWNFNCLPKLPDGRANPFHDPRVRRAFSMAVDKAAIADQVRRCGEPVAPSLIPAGSIAGYTPPKGVPFDPAAARQAPGRGRIPRGQGVHQRRTPVHQGRRARPDRAGHRQELAGVPGRLGHPGAQGGEDLPRPGQEQGVHHVARLLVRGLRRPHHLPGPLQDRRRQQRPRLLQPQVRRDAREGRHRAGPRQAPADPGRSRAIPDRRGVPGPAHLPLRPDLPLRRQQDHRHLVPPQAGAADVRGRRLQRRQGEGPPPLPPAPPALGVAELPRDHLPLRPPEQHASVRRSGSALRVRDSSGSRRRL